MKVNFISINCGGCNFEFWTTINFQAASGGEVGECLGVARRIHMNDSYSRIKVSTLLADERKSAAENYVELDEVVSALGPFIRASYYYRTAEFQNHVKVSISKFQDIVNGAFYKTYKGDLYGSDGIYLPNPTSFAF